MLHYRCLTITLLLTSFVTLGACVDRTTSDTNLIAPFFEVNKLTAQVGGPMEVEYRFKIAGQAEVLEKDYRVLVHFMDSRGNLLFADDHDPVPPTSAWRAGSTVEYTRTLFIPRTASAGRVSVEMGLYDSETENRLALMGNDIGQLTYHVGNLILEPIDEGRIVFGEGWHERESPSSGSFTEWRWTERMAFCSLKNPKADSLLYLRASTNVAAFETPLITSIKISGQEVTRFTVETAGPFLMKIPVSAGVLGSENRVELQIVNDQSFVPSESGTNSDNRELALVVYEIHLDSLSESGVGDPSARVHSDAFESVIDSVEMPLERVVLAPRSNPPKPYKQRYDFTAEWDYFTINVPVWTLALNSLKGKPNLRYLEVGVFEGMSAIWMLESVLTHPTSRMTGIDVFFDYYEDKGEAIKERFLSNVEQCGARDKVDLMVGYSQVELRKLPVETFDVIYIDAGSAAVDVLEDALLCWRLLKVGGIMILDDYEWNLDLPHELRPMLGINVFVKLNRRYIDLIHRDYQVILRKRLKPA